MYLPDVNIWLALTFESHAMHDRAQMWFGRNADSGLVFCRVTQQGFLRLATNPKAFGEDAVDCAGAWRLYDRIAEDSRVIYLQEPPGTEATWRAFSEPFRYSAKVWTDSYLAAFSVAAKLDLTTFDSAVLTNFPVARVCVPPEGAVD